MRMLIHLWMVLTLVLGICGDDMVRRAAEEGSGQLVGSGGLPITGGSDDEDYSSLSSVSSSNFRESYSEGVEGSGSYSSESEMDSFPSEEPMTNAIRFRGEFTLNNVGQGEFEWTDALTDPSSNVFTTFSNLISPYIEEALQSKKTTRKGLLSVDIIGFRHGSIIIEYEAAYSPESRVTSDQVRKSLKDAIASNKFGALKADPKSVSLVTQIQPSGVVIPEEPATTPPMPVKTDPQTTTQSNAINERTEGRSETGGGNEVDPITIDDETPADPENEATNEIGNELGQKTNPEPEAKMNFWDKLFSHPLILAGLVGAVVLALLTVVLLLMFIVYRIKKKDEGSYSLDEPHKVKDPMAYWKDTKEFYA